MALPVSRELTLSGASPVPSALLNRLQDCVVGNLHGELEIPFGPGGWSADSSGSAAGVNGEYVTLPTGSTIHFGISIPIGRRLLGVEYEYDRLAGNFLGEVDVFQFGGGGPGSIISGTVTDTVSAAGRRASGRKDLGALTLASGMRVQVLIGSGASAVRFYGGRLWIDNL